MLGSKRRDHETRVWLVNTGWTGGPYGEGERIKLKYTRAMIKAAMSGSLDHVRYGKMEPFHLQYPSFCPGVPTDVLNPRNTWEDSLEYDKKASYLADMFSANFSRFADLADKEIIDAGPKSMASVVLR